MVALMRRAEPTGMVRVIHGASDGVFPVAGHTVGSVRRSVADAFNVPGHARPFVNGEPVGDGYWLEANDTLEFVARWGRKGAGGGNPARITEGRLNDLGYRVEGDQAVPLGNDTPDDSWGLDRLGGYARAQMAASGRAEQEAALQAHKSAVALFWAGCALFFAREKCKAEGHGRWAEWKREKELKDTTVNDAIRLYENAKTEDALIGLGITEAKKRFVYPEGEGDAIRPRQKKGSRAKRRVTPDDGWGTEGRPPFKLRSADAGSTEGSDGESAAPPDEEPAGDEPLVPARTLVDELNDIAQRITEIALDRLGTVEDVEAVADAAAGVSNALDKLHEQIERRLPRA